MAHHHHLEPDTKSALLRRLKRAEGQLAAVQRMLEADDACVDVLLQISATQGAMTKVGQILLSSHIENCVAEALTDGDEEERKKTIDELMEVFSRYSSYGGRS